MILKWKLDTDDWKVNLVILSIGQFLVMSGMSMIMPFLPLYLQGMKGVNGLEQTTLWASWIFSASYVTSFFVQPLWGYISDRYGRKIMLLRSGFGMATVIILMGFCTSVWQLLALRVLNGAVAGFSPVAISLMAAITPREKNGYAMGVLQSANVAGTILGPIIGGLFADLFGFRQIFYLTGLLLFLATLLAMLFIKPDSKQASEKANGKKISFWQSIRGVLSIKELPPLFLVSLIIQFSLMATMPQIPIYVVELYGSGNAIALVSGIVGAIVGISNMIVSPFLGKLSDEYGAEKIVIVSLIGAAITTFPQAFVQNIWQLILLRFVLGCFIGGLLPSVYSLIRRHTISGMESQTISLNQSMLNLGSMLGPLAGGFIASYYTLRSVFVCCAIFLLINALMVKRYNTQPNKKES